MGPLDPSLESKKVEVEDLGYEVRVTLHAPYWKDKDLPPTDTEWIPTLTASIGEYKGNSCVPISGDFWLWQPIDGFWMHTPSGKTCIELPNVV
jgi:hypothetical protein